MTISCSPCSSSQPMPEVPGLFERGICKLLGVLNHGVLKAQDLQPHLIHPSPALTSFPFILCHGPALSRHVVGYICAAAMAVGVGSWFPECGGLSTTQHIVKYKMFPSDQTGLRPSLTILSKENGKVGEMTQSEELVPPA